MVTLQFFICFLFVVHIPNLFSHSRADKLYHLAVTQAFLNFLSVAPGTDELRRLSAERGGWRRGSGHSRELDVLERSGSRDRTWELARNLRRPQLRVLQSTIYCDL